MWHKLLKIHPLAANFLRYDLRDGSTASFWFDNRSNLGSLFTLAGDTSIHELGIARYASVADVANSTRWRIRRSRNLTYRHLRTQLTALPIPAPRLGPDIPLWKHAHDVYMPTFLSPATWQQIRLSYPTQLWYKCIWFSQSILCYAFVAWLGVHDRLSMGARIRHWGLTQACTLCGELDETRDHLFFACPYSLTIWSDLTTNLLHRLLTPDWETTLSRLQAIIGFLQVELQQHPPFSSLFIPHKMNLFLNDNDIVRAQTTRDEAGLRWSD